MLHVGLQLFVLCQRTVNAVTFFLRGLPPNITLRDDLKDRIQFSHNYIVKCLKSVINLMIGCDRGVEPQNVIQSNSLGLL